MKMKTMVRLAALALLVTSTGVLAAPPADGLTTTVDQVIDGAIEDQRLVGAVVLISQHGELVYQRAAGFADREANRPMELDTVFRLSSVSKVIASAAALALVDRGQLALDEPVTTYLPSFQPQLPNGTTPVITIRQLLTHTAGLSYRFAEPPGSPYHQAGVSDGFDDIRVDLSENLRRIASAPLYHVPGEAFRYSVAIDVLGAAVEQAAGKCLQAAVAELVTEPLGIHDTAFYATTSERLAVPYYNAEPEPAPMADPQILPFGEAGQVLTYSPARALDPRAFPSAGAGMVGTAPDLVRLLETIRTGGAPILDEDTAASMLRDQIGPLDGLQPGTGFGFGGGIVVDPAAAQTPQSAGTWQWGGAYGHNWFVDPALGLTVVVFTNTVPEGLTGAFTTDFRDAVYEALGTAQTTRAAIAR